MNDLFDSFAWRKFTASETLAKIKPGDWVYTTPAPTDSVLYGQIVQLERPQYSPGIARKVLHNAKHPEGGRHLVFEDGTTIVPRSGTAAAYRFLLDDKGGPLPVPLYPVCPSCGAGMDNPSCVTKDGKSTGVHSPRKRMPAPTPTPVVIKGDQHGRPTEHDAELVPAPMLKIGDVIFGRQPRGDHKDVLPVRVKDVDDPDTKLWTITGFMWDGRAADVSYNIALDGGYHGIGVHKTEWLRPVPGSARFGKRETTKPKASRQTDLVDGSYAAAGTGKSVRKDTDGRVWIDGWDKGEGEHTTPEGWRVHVSVDGEVTVLGHAKPVVAPNIKPASEQQLDPEDPMDGEDGADELPENTVKCEKCRGFGVVRGKGANAGKHYRKWSGALQAKDNGNAVECPQCQGDTIVAA